MAKTRKCSQSRTNVVSEEDWKALVRAEELSTEKILRADRGMGTGTGTGTGNPNGSINEGGGTGTGELYSGPASGNDNIYANYEMENVSWFGTGFASCSAMIEQGNLRILSFMFNMSFSGSTYETIINGRTATYEGQDLNGISGTSTSLSASATCNFVVNKTIPTENGESNSSISKEVSLIVTGDVTYNRMTGNLTLRAEARIVE